MVRKDALHALEDVAQEELSPAKAKTALRSLTELLHPDTEPMECDTKFFVECYSTLEQAARENSTLPPEEQSDYKAGNVKVLDILEFQASWHVLQPFGRKRFKEALPEQRREAYLKVLYKHAETFPFFEQRRKAIIELSEAQMIH